ncbi:hypothetical protein OW763_01985 [Clostridium aestuarii]|uniref:SipL SPOCS domain-containing protein n=1 Tax=Clostridium aestuarii TaxID=338193 RepID=A0ABT4CVU8_9CLOT|nr:hypothetical protein [Clostridium aestuarii]MCY6483124.1 hypothetical protein [Clostridium aestuarii]
MPKHHKHTSKDISKNNTSHKHKHKNKNYEVIEENENSICANSHAVKELKKDYSAKLNSSKLLQEYSSKPLDSSSISGPLICMLPVILSEIQIKISIDAVIELPEPALEITKIDKKVLLNECDIICETSTLFLNGFIRQNIQYASVTSTRHKTINGNIKYSVIYIPFEIATKIDFNTPPQFKDISEKPFCKLDSSKIMETDIKETQKPLRKFFMPEYTFENLHEKIATYLNLKILQNQDILIPESAESCEK